MKECNYPFCEICEYPDCIMESSDIKAMQKRHKYHENLEESRQKQRDYRKLVNSQLPECDKCEYCITVDKEKQDGKRRVCKLSMRLIEQKVTKSPHWCEKRNGLLAMANTFKFDSSIIRGDVCPSCKSEDVGTVDSRAIKGQRVRRRKCNACGCRWNTIETFYNYVKGYGGGN